MAGAMARVEQILNRGGAPDEKVLEARAVLASELRLLGEKGLAEIQSGG